MDQQLTPADELLKVPDVCKKLKMSRSHFYKSELAKCLIKVGRASYVSQLAIHEWIAKKRKEVNKTNNVA
jgi:predicted DNA-binding transcriptional regulator AlpA